MSKFLKNGYIDHDDPDFARPMRTIRDIPDGFSPYKIKTKTWFECTNINENNGLQCSIHISQENWAKCNAEQKIEVINHKHFYPTMEIYVQTDIAHHDAEVTSNTQLNLEDYQKKILVLIGKHNLPLTLINSVAFKDLLYEMVVIGQRNPTTHPKTLVKIESRPINTKHFINLAAELVIKAFDQFKAYQYVCLCLDAGKVGSHNYLEIYIANANIKEHPKLLRSVKDFGGNKQDYINAISDAMFELRRLKLVCSGITADNLRVQWSAFAEIAPLHNVIAIPCGCHCLNLSLSYARKQNEELDMMCSALEVVAQILNRKPIKKLFHLSCPQPIATRWVILFDVALWIVQHIKECIDFVENQEILELKAFHKYIPTFLQVIFDIAPKIAYLLLPMKLLMNALERNNTSCVDIFPLTKSATLLMGSMISHAEFLAPIAQTIMNCVEAWLTRSKGGLIQYTLFLFTVQGFKAAQIINNVQNPQPEKLAAIYREFYPLSTKPFEAAMKLCLQLMTTHKYRDYEHIPFAEHIKAYLGERYPESDAIITSLNGDTDWEQVPDENLPQTISYARPVPVDTPPNHEGITEFANDVQQVRNETIFEDDINDVDVISEQPYNMFDVNDQFIFLATSQGFEIEVVTQAIQDFFSDPVVLQKVESNPTNLGFWHNLAGTKYQCIAATMLIYSVIVASESICERSFNQKRSFLIDERNRTGIMLAEARNGYLDTPIEAIFKRLGIKFRFIE